MEINKFRNGNGKNGYMGILIKRLIPIILLLALPLYAQAQGLKDDSLFLNRLGLNNSGLVHGNGGIDQSDNLPSYDSLTTAYFLKLDNAGITYTQALKTEYDKYIFYRIDTANGGLMRAKIVCLWLLAPDSLLGLADTTRCKQNLFYPNFTLTTVNALTWQLGLGVSSNGTSSYLNTNFNPTTSGTAFTLNSAGLGFYSRTSIAAGATVQMGVSDGAGKYTLMQVRFTGDLNYSEINQGSLTSTANNTTLGKFNSARTSSSVVTMYRNGVTLGAVTGTQTSGNLPNRDIYLMCNNNNGSATNFSGSQFSEFDITSGLTGAEAGYLNTIIEDWHDYKAIGVQ